MALGIEVRSLVFLLDKAWAWLLQGIFIIKDRAFVVLVGDCRWIASSKEILVLFDELALIMGLRIFIVMDLEVTKTTHMSVFRNLAFFFNFPHHIVYEGIHVHLLPLFQISVS